MPLFLDDAAAVMSLAAPSDLLPDLHLPRYLRAATPIVAAVGDSTTTSADVVSLAHYLWPLVQAAMMRDNPDRSHTFWNFGIGAQSWQTAYTKPPSNIIQNVPWYTDGNANWLTYPQAKRPHVLLWNFGANAPGSGSALGIKQCVDVVAAWDRAPDQLFVTPSPRSALAPVVYDSHQDDLERMDNAAASVRSWCEVMGYGFLDLHRLVRAFRDGVDVRSQVMTLRQSLVAATWPYTFARTAGDIELEVALDNTGGAIFGSGTGGTSKVVAIQIGTYTDNYLTLQRSTGTGNLTVSIFANTGVTSRPSGHIFSSFAVPNGVLNFRMALRGSYLTIYCNGTLVIECMIIRNSGWFSPTIAFSGADAATAQAFAITRYATGSFVQVRRGMQDSDLNGPPGGSALFGGNGINHQAATAYARAHATLLDRTRFRGGRPSTHRSMHVTLRCQTVGTTPGRLTSDAAAATTRNSINLPNNSSMTIRGTVLAVRTNGDTAAFRVDATIKRLAAANTAALVGTASVVQDFADSAASGYSLAITADTTNGTVNVTGTGTSGHTVDWTLNADVTIFEKTP